MTNIRLHILGASGSGTTTLGKAIARKLAVPSCDVDDVYWFYTDPPYLIKRPIPERLRILNEQLAGNEWVLSGSLCGWGDEYRPRFTHVLFLRLDNTIRLERLRKREYGWYGSRIDPGGDMRTIHEDFMAWCNLYEIAGMEVRSLFLHRAWLDTLSCPILELNTEQPVEHLIGKVEEWMGTGVVSKR